MSKLEEIEQLQRLKESGAITQEEFEIEKHKVLNEQVSQTNKETINKKSKAKLFFILAGIFLVVTIMCIIITLYMNNKFYQLTDESDYAWSKYSYDGTKSAYNHYEEIIEKMENVEDMFKIFLYISFGIGAITIIMIIIGIVLKVKEKGGNKNVNKFKK